MARRDYLPYINIRPTTKFYTIKIKEGRRPVDYFTSDWNLNHHNIISYQNRPFKTIDEMNKTIIDNCNRRACGPSDRLFILGGFVFGPLDEGRYIDNVVSFRRKLTVGQVFLIYGNHDRRGRKSSRFRDLFTYTGDYLEVISTSQGSPPASLILSHYPIEYPYWNRIKDGSIHLHGHMYTSFCHSPRKLDVGVDGFAARTQREKKNPQVLPEDYGVWSLEDILEEISNI